MEVLNMKKMLFLVLCMLGALPTLQAQKIAYQFKTLRKQVDILARNATKTWEAIDRLNKQFTCYEKKMLKRHHTVVYKYNKPFFHTGFKNYPEKSAASYLDTEE